MFNRKPTPAVFVIPSDKLLGLFKRVAFGEDPELLMMEILANSEIREGRND